MPLGGDGGVGQFRGAVFVLKVLVTDRALVMQLDTIFGTGGFRTVHLGEAVSLGGDGGVGHFCGAVFVLEVLAADRAVVVLFYAVFGTGGVLAGDGFPGVTKSLRICLLLDHIAAHGTDLSL